MRRGVKAAVSWRIVSELFRRHHARFSLRVYENHPCSGQYDCLSICSGHSSDMKHLCDLNQSSSHLHVWEHVGPARASISELRWPDENDYVQAYLRSDDSKETIDQVESLVGLSCASNTPLPATTPPVLTVRLISALLERHAFSRFGLDARNGYLYTDGMWQEGIRKDLLEFSAVANQIPADPKLAERVARRFWLIYRFDSINDRSSKAVLDIRRAVAYTVKGAEICLWEQYRSGCKLATLVEQLSRCCDLD
jgi:hypothetical protein